MQIRTRFAPTPSGYLHAGNAFSFVLTWLIARQAKGRVLLRIDDLDASRKRPEYVDDIFASIDWLGLDFDEGPIGPDHFEREYSQQRRVDLYRAALERLRSDGHLFACECTRSSIKAAGGEHPDECRQRGTDFEQANAAWRIRTDESPITWIDAACWQHQSKRTIGLSGPMKDFVVRRKDQIPAYQVASLVDDIHFDVNFIVRGEDLLDSTAAQRMLASHLAYEIFLEASFVHHPILLGADGAKLSKSAGASSLRAMRELDPTGSLLYRQLSKSLKLPAEATSAKEALSMWCESDFAPGP